MTTQSDIMTAVIDYTTEHNRPCPMSYLANKFGSDVTEVVTQLKKDNLIVGLRGRSGGLALVGSPIVSKRSEHSKNKASKQEEQTEPVAEAV
jgi:DNA-binding IscR family transcriptional regulator